jgi:hypothetical protein
MSGRRVGRRFAVSGSVAKDVTIAMILVMDIHGAALAGGTAGDLVVTDLSRCAAVKDRDDRLACYDALASRNRQPNGTPGGNVTNTSTPAPALAPKTAATSVTGAAPATAASSTKGVSSIQASPPPPAVTGPTTESREEFGLSVVQVHKEQSAPERIQSIDGVVTGFGQNTNGRPVVRLDNTQSWELDQADPLLTVGDKVTIRRATLGSFLMVTPTKRLHRVRRLS